MEYIGLLRGINVGGNNIIKMADLRASFERHGFTNVSTYINSGNIMFKSDEADILVLKKECEAIIKETFDLDILVAVIKATDLIEAVDNAPTWWNEDAESKHNAIIVIPPKRAEELIEQVGAANPEYEKVASYGSVIFWTAPKKTISRTQWFKEIGSSAYRCTTIRNANTTLKLATLAKDS